MRKPKYFKKENNWKYHFALPDFIVFGFIASFIFYPMLRPVIDYNIMKFKQISYRRK